MLHAILDVGSNTIRMVIYEISGTAFRDVAHERDFAKLITYVDGGILSEEGIEKILSVMKKMSKVCKKYNCEKIHCFATASLRNVENIDSVIEKIEEETGIHMVIISGDDEARYSFYGLISQVSDSGGIGFDLGGGSCELFRFEDRNLCFFKSLKIGGQVIHRKYVKDVLPTKDEMQNIYNAILSELAPLFQIKSAGFPVIYAMGGAARNAAKYAIDASKSSAPLEKYRLRRDALISLCADIAFGGGDETVLKIMPDRINTIIPGIITIIAIMDFSGAKEIEIVLQGVREGFLYENLLMTKL